MYNIIKHNMLLLLLMATTKADQGKKKTDQ